MKTEAVVAATVGDTAKFNRLVAELQKHGWCWNPSGSSANNNNWVGCR